VDLSFQEERKINRIVLDPMLGNGTTGIAALELNRRFMGIEKDRGTFKVASVTRRI
jgi:DNA modification methylase